MAKTDHSDPTIQDRLADIARALVTGSIDRDAAVSGVNAILDALPAEAHPEIARAADRVLSPALVFRGFESLSWTGGEEIPVAMKFPRYADKNDPEAVRMEHEANWIAAGLLKPEQEYRKVWTETNGAVMQVASLFGVPGRLAQARAVGLGLARQA